MSIMKITWLGHSCFRISHNGFSIVIDPYKPGTVPGLGKLDVQANMVLCSHSHFDHGFTDAVKIIDSGVPNPFSIEKIHTYHDDAAGAKRGENIIHVLEADGIRVAHFGDLGCPLTKKQVAQLGALDAAMMPVGGYYTLDAAQAKAELDKVDPAVIIPMHYRSAGFGFKEIGELTAFTELFDPALIKRYDSDTIEIRKGGRKEIAVLKLMN